MVKSRSYTSQRERSSDAARRRPGEGLCRFRRGHAPHPVAAAAATRPLPLGEAGVTRATLGVLLAGGLARRMGGGDKPLRTIGGRTILERAIERLEPQCEGLILNANGDPARFAFTGLAVVPDDVPGFAG